MLSLVEHEESVINPGYGALLPAYSIYRIFYDVVLILKLLTL